MDGGLPEYQEGNPSLGPFQKVTTEVGRRSFCFGKVLSGSGAGGFTIWGEYLGIVGNSGQKRGGVNCGIPLEGDRQDDKTIVGSYLEEGGGGEYPQGSGDP